MANGKNSHADDATMTTMPDYENEIITVLRGSVFPRAIQELLEDYHGNDIAQVMEDLTPQERSRFFKIASSDLLAETFEYLDEEDAIAYFHEIDLWKVIDILSKLDADKAEAKKFSSKYPASDGVEYAGNFTVKNAKRLLLEDDED